jgi:rhamnulokinase
MTSECCCVAIDLGAESCRVTLAQWDGTRAFAQPVHRFSNGPVERGARLYWNLDRIWNGIEEGLRLASEAVSSSAGSGSRKPRIDSIGVDGWAVDYVRLDSTGRLLDQPFCYRDSRTETAMPEVWERIARSDPQCPDGQAWLYERTGIQFLRFNTLYQLYADLRDGLEPGSHWVNLPEYLLYRLAGSDSAALIAEYTNATHTQLVDVSTRTWCDAIFQRAGLDRAAAPRIVPPGTHVGMLNRPLANLPAYSHTHLIAPACHDTGSAVAGIPEADTDWAFISSGTWSLVGALLEAPCTTAAARQANFTNEGGIGGRIRFLKNVNGMWLLQECMREWNSQKQTWTMQELVAECERRPPCTTAFPVDSADLLLPGNMPARINAKLEEAGQRPLPVQPEHAPEMANMIFTSLARRYAEVLQSLRRVTGRAVRRLYVVGGGSQNEYLNRLIQEHTAIEVMRGPVESSTIGNLAVQFAALEFGTVTPATVAAWAARLDPGARSRQQRSESAG